MRKVSKEDVLLFIIAIAMCIMFLIATNPNRTYRTDPNKHAMTYKEALREFTVTMIGAILHHEGAPQRNAQPDGAIVGGGRSCSSNVTNGEYRSSKDQGDSCHTRQQSTKGSP